MELSARTKPVRIAFNMLCCAILFAWACPKPRETISGLFGRKYYWDSGHRFWLHGCKLIDKLHRTEPEHCLATARLEVRARRELGYGPL